MDKFRIFLSKWGMATALVLLILLNFNNCTSKVKNKKRDAKIVVMDSTINEIAKKESLTEPEIKVIVEDIMLEFIIIEDELDHKKITISEVMERLKARRKAQQ